MRVQHLLFLGLISALSPRAATAAEAGWTTGLDLVLETGAGLKNAAGDGRAFHGLALAHAEWTQTPAPNRPLHFRGFASVLTIAGHGPSERFLGDFLAASNMEGHNSTRLYSTWLEAGFGEWSLRAGALLADEEFIGTEAGGHFLNSAFGWPAFVSANTVNTGPAFFVAAPGLRLERRFGETAALRLGVYDGDTFDSPTGDPHVNRHGYRYRLTSEQGSFIIGELSLTPTANATRFKAGAWMHTATFADVRDDATGGRLAITGAAPREHSSNYGAYAIIEHTLAGKSGEAGYTTGFLRAGVAPKDRNTISWALDTGLARTGLLPGRPDDIAALGVTHAAFSPRFAAHARAADPMSPAPDFEQVVELTYSLILSDRFTVQPDLHYIRHPGGSAAQRNTLAFLLRLKASF